MQTSSESSEDVPALHHALNDMLHRGVAEELLLKRRLKSIEEVYRLPEPALGVILHESQDV